MNPSVVSRIALANVIANGVIVVTGGAVRLTGSGLGCPTWPECTDGSIRPTPELAGHGLIEFGNRLLTFAVAVIAIATVLAVFASVRKDLRKLAVLSFLGIPAQALLGGVTVLTGLNPWTVALHFLLSRRSCGCGRVSPAWGSCWSGGPSRCWSPASRPPSPPSRSWAPW
jgi:cytochrome c oxidase assembly protein subunit 15